MGELVPMTSDSIGLLYERAASYYVEMLDERVKPPKLDEVYDELSKGHPDDYPAEAKQQFLAKLRTDQFNDILAERRKQHIVDTLAPRLLAAQMGSRIGSLALEKLAARLESGEEVADKTLIEAAKLGFSLTDKVDKDVSEVAGGNVKVENAFSQIILALPEDRAQALIGDVFRRLRMQAVESDVIEGKASGE